MNQALQKFSGQSEPFLWGFTGKDQSYCFTVFSAGIMTTHGEEVSVHLQA
jgi:hypothetical protein